MSQTKPSVPTWATIVGALAAVVLVVGAFFVGRAIGSPADAKELGPIVTPEVLVGLTRADVQTPEPVAGVDKEIVRANYTDGKDRVLLMISRPEPDLEKFMTDAGVQNLQQVIPPTPGIDVLCGASKDTQMNACAMAVGEEARLVYGLTKQPNDKLTAMLSELLKNK